MGRRYEQIEQDPRWANVLADRDGGQGLVLTLTDGLIGALAQANTEQLARVAVPGSATEEFWGQGDPEALTSLLGDLSMLAHDARARGESLSIGGCPSEPTSSTPHRALFRRASFRRVRDALRIRPHHGYKRTMG